MIPISSSVSNLLFPGLPGFRAHRNIPLAVLREPENMDKNDKVLTVEVWHNEFHYRIRRGSRVVYVSVFHKDIIPGEMFERTENRAILSHLRLVPKWNEEWTSLTVYKTHDGTIESILDEFPPHSLDINALGIRDQPFFDILSFESTSRLSDRVYQVTLGDKTMMMKIAPYQYMLPALHHEVAVYSLLASRGFARAPKLLGYVYEESKARTIGFLMERISENRQVRKISNSVKRPFDYFINAVSSMGISTNTTFVLRIKVPLSLTLKVRLSRKAGK